MARLPVVAADAERWGEVLNEYLLVGHDEAGHHRLGWVVTEHGADNTGATACGEAINAVIQGSAEGDAIIFPGGPYKVDIPILLLPKRTYFGLGRPVLRQADDTELPALVMMDPSTAIPRTGIRWQGIDLDGNRANNTAWAFDSFDANHGMHLDDIAESLFTDFTIANCANRALRFEEASFGNRVISAEIKDSANTAITFGPASYDNQVHSSAMTNAGAVGVDVNGYTTTVANCTIQGSGLSGIRLWNGGSNITGCRIQRNGQYGIYLGPYAWYCLIEGCDIYANSVEDDDTYEAIYLAGIVGVPIRAPSIIGNHIWSGRSGFGGGGTGGKHYRAIELGEYHSNAVVNANSMDHQAPDADFEAALTQVNNIKPGDTFHGRRIVTETWEIDAVTDGEILWRTGADGTGGMHLYSYWRGRYERIPSYLRDMQAGTASATTGASSAAISITDMDDTDFAVTATPSWPTTVYVTGKTATGFTVNFGTVVPAGTHSVAWTVTRHT